MSFLIAQAATPAVPTEWITAILGPYGAVVVLLIVIFLLLTERPWGLIPRHQFRDMKEDRDRYRQDYTRMIDVLTKGTHVTLSAVELAKQSVSSEAHK